MESEEVRMAVEIKCGILHNRPCDRGCRHDSQCVIREFPADHPYSTYLIKKMLFPRRLKRAVKK